MLKLFLWLRYLRKKKIVLLSIAAVALSVALMIVVDSLFTGYIDALQQSAVVNIGDIFLWPRQRDVPKYDLFVQRLEKLEQVEAAAPFLYGGGLLWLEKGDVTEVAIQGISPAKEFVINALVALSLYREFVRPSKEHSSFSQGF